MTNFIYGIAACACMLGCLPAVSGVQAAELLATQPALSRPEPAMGPDAAAPFASGASIDAVRLDGMRGGTDTVTNDQTLRGTVGTNVATNVVTGANTISSGSFASASGIPIVIQNSGANVLIQNATVINLQMH